MATSGVARKAVVDAAAYANWPIVSDGRISGDGNYAAYKTRPRSTEARSSSTLVATSGRWRREIPESEFIGFTEDSRAAVVSTADNRILLVQLGSGSQTALAEAFDSQLVSQSARDLLLYRRGSPAGELVLRDLHTGRERLFKGVSDYQVGKSGRVMILRSVAAGSESGSRLVWVDLVDGGATEIWHGGSIGSVVLDEKRGQLAFSEVDLETHMVRAIWTYMKGDEAPRLLVSPATLSAQTMAVKTLGLISPDGKDVMVTLALRNTGRVPEPEGKLHIWRYTDSPLIPREREERSEFAGAISLGNGSLTRIEGPQEHMAQSDSSTLVLRQDGDANPGEGSWNLASRLSYYAMTGAHSQRTVIFEHKTVTAQLSPAGRFVVYYDTSQHNYLSYEVATGKVRNISALIPRSWWFARGHDQLTAEESARPPAAWLQGDVGLLLYDSNDIWLVDPMNSNAPVNLTNSYGLRHHLVFSAIDRDDVDRPKALEANTVLTLVTFDQDTKETGYYLKALDNSGDPQRLTMGPYLYVSEGLGGEAPIKAAHAMAYLVSRESESESRNYFFTTDFRSFSPISDVRPERQYNWLKGEYMHWTMPDGGVGEGVLYKPEDFDSTKKYPVIFYIYEVLSDRLHTFKPPGFSVGQIDIPTFVSRGYLVFTPDIHPVVGDPMNSALNAVEAAARYLSGQSWVDSARLGLQGLSYGGIETNYIVTHSHLFAAANASSGDSDFVSAYNLASGGGDSLQPMFETGQNRIGATLWERPDLYIKNSAIFSADQVTTPLLLMHTTNDGICPLEQAEELFSGLRRLGKRVWMLQYDDQNHGLLGAASVDFTARQLQFFDHFLRGSPTPRWMTPDAGQRSPMLNTERRGALD
jgi:dipeptidyl aminopeptidase/acylaminoacyl peptidase